METCDYGCGQDATHHYANGKNCCSPRPRQCPHVSRRATETRRANGPWHSQETCTKIKSTSKETRKTSWIAGKRKNNDPSVAAISNKLRGRVISEDTKEKISEAKIGSIPWNKGLRAETDSRILAGDQNGMFGQTHSSDAREIFRANSSAKWRGSGNPWFGKTRSGAAHPSYQGEAARREYRDYVNRVAYLTEKTYAEFERRLNPHGKPRTLCGVAGGYQLDHIVPIKEGFRRGIDPSFIASVENLQLISWQDNRAKQAKLTAEAELLLERFLRNSHD